MRRKIWRGLVKHRVIVQTDGSVTAETQGNLLASRPGPEMALKESAAMEAVATPGDRTPIDVPVFHETDGNRFFVVIPNLNIAYEGQDGVEWITEGVAARDLRSVYRRHGMEPRMIQFVEPEFEQD